jgi:hypothetical protein
MKAYAKPTVALAAGAIILLGVFCQTARAQFAPLTPGGPADTGTAALADALGVSTGPEALTISWSVSENVSDIYTYSYVVNNPMGDVVLNNMGGPTMTPEIVDAFSVGFDTTFPGAYVNGSIAGGNFDQNLGPDGLSWAFTGVNPGSSSPMLSFESLLPPTLGNANAADRNPPSPWSSVPNGQMVPVPTPEPSPLILFALTALLFLPFRSTLLRFVRQK